MNLSEEDKRKLIEREFLIITTYKNKKYSKVIVDYEQQTMFDYSIVNNKKTLFISCVFLHPSLRKLGLIEYMINLVLEQNKEVKTITLQCTNNSKKYWQKKNFVFNGNIGSVYSTTFKNFYNKRKIFLTENEQLRQK